MNGTIKSMALKNKLKIARVTRGDLTQQELADRVSCSRQTIHSIESSKFVPSIELVLKLAKALEYKVEDLFSVSSFTWVLIIWKTDACAMNAKTSFV